jgi:hypothetical protein
MYMGSINLKRILLIPLNDQKIDVWCAISVIVTVEPLSFEHTTNSEWYITDSQYF